MRKFLRWDSVKYRIDELILIQNDEGKLAIHLMQCPNYPIKEPKKKKPYYNNDISK